MQGSITKLPFPPRRDQINEIGKEGRGNFDGIMELTEFFGKGKGRGVLDGINMVNGIGRQ
jgi:hypothetical protein